MLPKIDDAIVKGLGELAKDVLLAAVAAWFAVKQSIREFSSQRWWDRREEAYRKIIEALSQIQLILSRIGNMRTPEFVSPEEQLERWKNVMQKIDDLATVFHEGSFRISRASNAGLRELITNWYSAAPVGEGWEQEEMLQRYSAAVEKCRDVIDVEARRDLRLPARR